MGYLALIIVFIIVIKLVEKKTFRWETVVRHLWKQIYVEADQMASHMKQFNIKEFDKLSLQGYKSQIEFRGKLINSIIDYINLDRDQEETEEETFGYGRYNFDTILMMAKSKIKYQRSKYW